MKFSEKLYMNKINRYIFFEISKGCLLMFFIFLSIGWILQFTRLISLTNLIQVELFTIFYLSIFLVPNLITIIMPFVIMFGLIITFMKLHRDRELISIYSLGLNIKSITKPLIYFTLVNLLVLISFNFFLSPIIYKDYKLKEYEIRNKINFEKIIISNFIEINDNTYLDFRKDSQQFKEVFIKFKENKNNIIYAKEAFITQNNQIINFNLINGFKITIIENNKIEKLEFDEYTLKIKDDSYEEYDNFDNNTFHVLEDIKSKNYINIFYKTIDSLIIILIIIFFYFNNILVYKYNLKSFLFYLFFSSILLIFNQILKNSNFNLNTYLYSGIIFLILLLSYFIFLKNNVQN